VNAPTINLRENRSRPRAPRADLVPSLERRRLRIYCVQIVIDSILLLGSSYVSAIILQGSLDNGQPLLAAQLMLPIFLTIALHNGTYSQGALTDWRTAVWKLVSAMLVAAALLNFLAFFVKINAVFSRAVFISSVASSVLAMAAARFVLLKWMVANWGPSPMNRLVINAGGPAVALSHAYQVDAREHELSPTLEDPHMLDRLARYLHNMDQVVVSCPLEERLSWAQVLKSCGVHGEVTSDLAREIGAIGVVHHDDAGVSTLLVASGPLGMRARATKRIFDLAVSATALVLLAPVLLAAMAAIKLEDGGPVFFRQRRLGRGNRFFSIYKLRSMRIETCDAAGHRSTGRDDDRITRVGRFLRRTSMDELPQLLNVLNGDMSIVGPRPHALGSQAGSKLFWQVDSRYWQRHTLRPGITGLAQIRGFRGATEKESDLSSRLQADLEYLTGWSIWRDVRIIVATFKVLVHEQAF
jgi:exopolysaccharide biosynthesis polyprenyl glycosylphosphotransferase